jgi:hypothetical protein
LIDTNVFIASIKHPDRKTGYLDLVLDLINNPDVCLVGNYLLLLEFEKYQKRFESPLAYKILKDLKYLDSSGTTSSSLTGALVPGPMLFAYPLQIK